jgi:hypothetical protein
MGLVKVRKEGAGFRFNLMGQWFDAVGHVGGVITLEKRILGIRIPLPQLEGLAIHVLDFEGKLALGLGSTGYRGIIAVPVEASPLPPAWKARLGTYEVVDSGGAGGAGGMLGGCALSVDKESGLFVVGIGGGRERAYLPLRAVSDTECVIEGLGRNLGETIEAVGDSLVYEGLVLVKK